MSALSKLYSGELEGISARLIEVEVDLHVGLHSFTIVGLGDKAVGEAKERVNAALKNSNKKSPNRENRRITVNLAPATIRKTGSQYDLAIALGYLCATKQIVNQLAKSEGKIIVLGELALDGRIRAVRGVLNIALLAKEHNFETIIVPKSNEQEARAIQGIKVRGVVTLQEAIDILENRKLDYSSFRETNDSIKNSETIETIKKTEQTQLDFSDIHGQHHIKRALMIAAAGHHNALLIGPPGVGKSALAERIPTIIPNLTEQEAIEVTQIYSSIGSQPNGLITQAPFRTPHHTASAVAILGGGTPVKPGEITLAHHGILFLDEFPEFNTEILQSLRTPLEEKVIHIARVKDKISFPTNTLLVAAMNPCPCGYYQDPGHPCRCGAKDILRYNKKLSGPLMDRIDLHIQVPRISTNELRPRSLDEDKKSEKGDEETESETMRQQVEQARAHMKKRFRREERRNGDMTSREVQELIKLSDDAKEFLLQLESNKISGRAYYRLIKVAQTIADLENSEIVTAMHCAEAFRYRKRD